MAIALLSFTACCASAEHRVRRSLDEPPGEREIEARARFAEPGCKPALSAFFPGLGQLSCGRPGEGRALALLGAAELGTAIGAGAARGFSSAAAEVPLLAYADLLTASAIDVVLDAQRAARLPFVPQETLPELLRSPFEPRVLARPAVWAGVLGALAASLLLSRLVDGPLDTRNFGTEPVLFGSQLHDAVGYPIAGAIGAALFAHVAVAEETAFRGALQGGWARATDETRGWAYSSLAFGLLHAGNLPFIDARDRLKYLYAGVPFITALGGYLGWTYRDAGYALSTPVAIHFWYDFLVEAIDFLADPKNSPLSMRLALAF
ncbi:MAG: CPBP family intramembrane glutamic endopeptidase [Myxococcales bacterium]